MGIRTRSKLEASLDPANRVNIPGNVSPHRWGNKLIGMNVNGLNVNFLTDLMLSPGSSGGMPAMGLYEGTERPDWYPTSTPTSGGITAVADPTGTSEWDANPRGAGANFGFYIITQRVNGVESFGVRFPAGTGYMSNVAGQRNQLIINHQTDADQLVVYRGYPTADGGVDGGASTANPNVAWKILDVSADASGQTTFFDYNLWRPNTEVAFGLNIDSPAFNMATGSENGYAQLQANPENIGSNPSGPNANCAQAVLGTAMSRAELPKLVGQPGRSMIYTARGFEARDAEKLQMIKNILPT